MGGFFTWILNFVSGGALDKVEKIVSDYTTAATDEQKAQLALAAQDMANRSAIVQSEIGSRLLQWPRFIIEMGTALYWTEAVPIDKGLGSLLHKFGYAVDWSTDPITGDLAVTYTLVMGAMFGGRIAETIVGKITGRP